MGFWDTMKRREQQPTLPAVLDKALPTRSLIRGLPYVQKPEPTAEEILARGETISAAPTQERSPLGKVVDMLPARLAGSINRTAENVRKFVAPTRSEQMVRALEEDPTRTQEELIKRADELDRQAYILSNPNDPYKDRVALMADGAVSGSIKDVVRSVASRLTRETSETAIRRTLREVPNLIKSQEDQLIQRIAEETEATAIEKLISENLAKTEKQEGGFWGGMQQNQAQPFQNYEDLSTRLLSKLEGRTTVSKQFIADLTNSPDLKQPERDLFRRLLADAPDNVNVSEFADRVKAELLPLKSVNPAEQERGRTGRTYISNRYENVNLPDDLRGPVANYDERIYESPIKTSAGSVHFSGATDNYFAHSRIEDLPDGQTRRVVEVQSDLFQKGRLEREAPTKRFELSDLANPEDAAAVEKINKANAQIDARASEMSKLEPYRNTWWERVVREELKSAAVDGKQRVLFPTGETAMKIEGLGAANDSVMWVRYTDPQDRGFNSAQTVKPGTLKVGETINFGDRFDSDWIVTDVIDDGKFKAVPKRVLTDNNYLEDASGVAKAANDPDVTRYTETFDISGKVDTNNPIYKYYEKDVAKYLKNKFGATQITDERGVTWMEVKVSDAMRRNPVEAFGVAAGLEEDEEGNLTFNPLAAGAGVAAVGALSARSTRTRRGAGGTLPPDFVDTPPTTPGLGQPPLDIAKTLSSAKTIPEKLRAVFTSSIEYVQNTEERIRKLVQNKSLNTATDPYEIMALYYGRVGTKIEQGYQRAEEIAEDIITMTGRRGSNVDVGRAEVNDYLQALHAPERNAVLGDGAAGMTTEEAKEIVKNTPDAVKRVAEKALALHRESLELLRDSGVISKELFDNLRTKYKNHVPLQRVMDEQEDIGAILSGSGFDVRSTGIKKAVGSDRQVADILTNIVNNYEQAVLRSEKNIVDRATLAFFRNNDEALKSVGQVRTPNAKGLANRKPSIEQADEMALNEIAAEDMAYEKPYTMTDAEEAIGRAETHVLMELELAEAGGKIILDHNATRDDAVIAWESTFPDWVPDDPGLRRTDVFYPVLKHLRAGTTPRANATRQRELMEIVNNRIADLVPMDARDELALLELAKKSELRASQVEKIKAKKPEVLYENTQDPRILKMFEDGKPVWIEFRDAAMATAFRGVGREKIGTLLNVSRAFVNVYSMLATRFNPEFALPNKIRDLQETMTFLASQQDTGFRGAAKMAARDPKSMKDVLDAIRGADTPGARMYQEMKALGGTTGGFGLSTRKQTELNIDSIFRIAKSRPRQAAQKLVRYVDDFNTVFEDSTRLSVYKTALEKGATKERAAFLAKEASINFNRMGKGGPVINALWMFGNAAIQGTVKTLRALKNPKVAATVGASITTAVAAVSEWNDQVDPEWRDKVTEWDRRNSLPIMLPTEDGSTRYFSIPVSWGLKPIYVMATDAYDMLSGRDISATDAVNRALSSVIMAYNPVGGTDITSAITPTIADLPVEISRNQAWSGSLIRPMPYSNQPRDILYFDSLEETAQGRFAIETTKKLQESYGITISPADIDYVLNSYMGGAGRAVKKTFETIFGVTTGDMPPADEYPFLSRFYRERTAEETGQGAGGEIEKLKEKLSDQARENFHRREEAEAMYKEFSELPPEVAKDRFAVLKETNPLLAEKLVDIAKDEALGLTYEDKLIKALQVQNGERGRFLAQKFKELKSDEERAALWKEYTEKQLITPEVAEQVAYFISQ